MIEGEWEEGGASEVEGGGAHSIFLERFEVSSVIVDGREQSPSFRINSQQIFLAPGDELKDGGIRKGKGQKEGNFRKSVVHHRIS